MEFTKGLGVLDGGNEFITFKAGEPKTLLFIDWYDNLYWTYEHYEKVLNPSYVRCPGKQVCPLCQANPGKYASMRAKFRVYDPADGKVKFVSMSKTAVKALNDSFSIDYVDPTKTYVTIFRTGSGAQDTSYTARVYRPNSGMAEYPLPNLDAVDKPDIIPIVTPHTPEEIRGFMNALSGGNQPQYQQAQQAVTPQGFGQPVQQQGFQQFPPTSSMPNNVSSQTQNMQQSMQQQPNNQTTLQPYEPKQTQYQQYTPQPMNAPQAFNVPPQPVQPQGELQGKGLYQDTLPSFGQHMTQQPMQEERQLPFR